MQVNLYASFRERAGIRKFEMPVTLETTVQSMIHQILEKYPQLIPLWLDKLGELHGHVHISLNQVDVMALPDRLETKVQESDILDFYPPITGG